jgi:hypothetical protein
VYHWLAHNFEINLDTTLLTVYVVVKRDNMWALTNISNTNQWKEYIIEALGRGGPFDVLVEFHIKPQVAPVIIEEE